MCFPDYEKFRFHVGCLTEGEFGIKPEAKTKGDIPKERFLTPPASGKGFLLLCIVCDVTLRVSER